MRSQAAHWLTHKSETQLHLRGNPLLFLLLLLLLVLLVLLVLLMLLLTPPPPTKRHIADLNVSTD